MASSAPSDGFDATESNTLTLLTRSVWVLVAAIPSWIVAPSTAPDWKLNAGAFGFDKAATFWLIFTYEVTPTSAVVKFPMVICTLSKSAETLSALSRWPATEIGFPDVSTELKNDSWTATEAPVLMTCNRIVPSTVYPAVSEAAV